MTTAQLLLILAGLAVCQVIAMALPYWMGWQAGRSSLAPLQGEIEQLRQRLSIEGEYVVTVNAEGDRSGDVIDLVKPVPQGVSYV